MEKIWLKHYPPGVPPDVDTGRYRSLAELLDDCLGRWHDRIAFRCFGQGFGYARIDALSRAFAAYLQSLGVKRGDRVAVMLPNLPQLPVAVAAILRAGGVVVNVNPQLAPRELAHLLKDSGAQAIVLLENFAATLQAVVGTLPLRHVVLAATGDLLGAVSGRLVNHLVRNVRRQVPEYQLPDAVPFVDALAAGRRLPFVPPALGPDDLAVLQYTGGTTGAAKAAVLLHRNIVANLLQCEAWYRPALQRLPAGEPPLTVAALPLHHIFGFTVILMLGLHLGGCSLLIPDPHDTTELLKQLARHRVHSFPAVNPLFAAVARHPDVHRVDWSALQLAVGGGMAVQRATARLWLEKTGCPICEGYGLTETSPTVTCNPVDGAGWNGSIGFPLPGTELQLLDDQGAEVAPGRPGEIAVRGPQVMAGYWQRPDETARAMTADGWFRTGDIGTVDAQGRFTIVDRKRDMIMVGGFSVAPNEIEDVVGTMPGVLECAVVGVPDPPAGEAVKLVVVRQDAGLTEAGVRAWCDAHLPGCKRPRRVEFRDALPRSAGGKVLRRELRDAWP
ncbi:MAG: AMP-binding protein [Burkholderiales bacterium]|nr:AMP-binding protein [Burkholderiales bacterium]